MEKKYDLIIVGGGLSGLFLGYFLHQSCADLRVKILEQRKHYQHDRHWGVWLNQNQRSLLQSIISISYNRWSVTGSKGLSCIGQSTKQQYCVIRSGDFYQFMQDRLGEKIEYGAICEKITSHNITTNCGSYTSNMIVDARPLEAQNCTIYQQFYGEVVTTQNPVFNDEMMTLMDFSIDDNQGSCAFMYVLPFSQNKALIEPTIFTKTLQPPEYFQEQTKKYLARHNAGSWEGVDHEKAVLPMALQKPALSPEGVFPIGRRGGWMRASSGYSFYKSLILTKKLADYIAANRSLPEQAYHPYSGLNQKLDDIYLNVIEKMPEIMPDVFYGWFERMNSDDMVGFLNNEASWLTYLKLLRCTQHKKHFIEAAWKN